MEKQKNICGDCTLCCDLLPIPEIKKPHSQLCGDCVLSVGCSIHSTRPESCRTFNCLYIESDESEMGNSLKPNKSNVIFEKLTTNIYIAINHYNEPTAYKSKLVLDFIKSLNEKGISVATTSFTNETKQIFLAEGHSEEGVLSVILDLLNKQG
jgi:hypothetical protein|tara:strand:+ start:59 stop:517 length:459 start_codon:yes stop_codon:yes gene_type:complete